MQEIIKASQKMTALLIEYEQAKIYEGCMYHIVEQPGRWDYYFLIDIPSGQIIRTGSVARLKKWLHIRNIAPNVVYNYALIAVNEPPTEETTEQ